MKILHLATDDKFIDQAYTVFELGYPGENDVWIISRSRDLKFVKLNADRIIIFGRMDRWASKVSAECYFGYDLVIFHSFGDVIASEIFNIPKNLPTVWLGWGYDYYDLISQFGDLLLPETKNLAVQSPVTLLRSIITKSLRFAFNLAGTTKPRTRAIERLSLFAPVLPSEYDLVFRSRNWQSFPQHARWNYGTMEDHLIRGLEGEQVESSAILVGNSASPTCNHKDAFDMLVKIGVKNRKIIAPLSYGNAAYGDKIAELGTEYFCNDFNPLKNFMSIEDYVVTIKQCGYVIMNHKRQQAVGNIVIMLYLGARVFLREENPAFSFFNELGVKLSSVQELEKNIVLLDSPLSKEERDRNRRLVSEYWSRESGVVRTKCLVEYALSLVSSSGRAPGHNVPPD